jgi:hypothetical protein
VLQAVPAAGSGRSGRRGRPLPSWAIPGSSKPIRVAVRNLYGADRRSRPHRKNSPWMPRLHRGRTTLIRMLIRLRAATHRLCRQRDPTEYEASP